MPLNHGGTASQRLVSALRQSCRSRTSGANLKRLVGKRQSALRAFTVFSQPTQFAPAGFDRYRQEYKSQKIVVWRRKSLNLVAGERCRLSSHQPNRRYLLQSYA